MKILVVRFSSIGDVIWVTPVLRCLKQQLPKAEVHFCTKAVYQDLFLHNPNLDKLHLLADNLSDLLPKLKQEKFDYVIDLHKNLRTSYLKWYLQTKTYTYAKLSLEKWLYVNFRINWLPTTHIADRYLATLKPLNIVDDKKGLELHIPPAQEMPTDFYPESHQNGFIALVIGASYYTKKMPLHKIIELCELLAQPIVLVGGKEDMPIAIQITQFFEGKYGSKNPIFDTCGKLSLIQSASVVKRASVVFGHDTGLMHIAACFQKNIYSIWGSTVPLLGLYPYQTPYKVIENAGLSCRPCSRMGKKRCPKGHFRCMEDLDFSVIQKDFKTFGNTQ